MNVRKVWLGLGYAFVGLVVYLSLTPHPLVVPEVAEVKSGHVIAYGWLMLWFAQAYQRPRPRLLLVVAFVAMGVGLEYAQALTDYRTFAVSDMEDNALGAIAGWVLAFTPLGRIMAAIEARSPGGHRPG